MTQTELLLDPTGEKKRTSLTQGPVGQRIKRFFVKRLRFSWEYAPERARFHSGVLARYVLRKELIADGTTTRVLRMLREEGALDYEVINRSESLYRILGVVHNGQTLGRIRSEGGE